MLAAKRTYADIDTDKRWNGIVSAFSVHRFGFIKLNGEDEKAIQEFGNLKNKKLCFRVQDIDTEVKGFPEQFQKVDVIDRCRLSSNSQNMTDSGFKNVQCLFNLFLILRA